MINQNLVRLKDQNHLVRMVKKHTPGEHIGGLALEGLFGPVRKIN